MGAGRRAARPGPSASRCSPHERLELAARHERARSRRRRSPLAHLPDLLGRPAAGPVEVDVVPRSVLVRVLRRRAARAGPRRRGRARGRARSTRRAGSGSRSCRRPSRTPGRRTSAVERAGDRRVGVAGREAEVAQQRRDAEREQPAGPQQPRRPRAPYGRVAEAHRAVIAEHHVERCVAERDRGRARADELHRRRRRPRRSPRRGGAGRATGRAR